MPRRTLTEADTGQRAAYRKCTDSDCATASSRRGSERDRRLLAAFARAPCVPRVARADFRPESRTRWLDTGAVGEHPPGWLSDFKSTRPSLQKSKPTSNFCMVSLLPWGRCIGYELIFVLGGGRAPGGFQPALGTLLSVAKARDAHQGADCRTVGTGAVPDHLTWGDAQLGTGTMSRKWRGGSGFGGRFRKTAWKTWMFGFPFPKSGVVSRPEQEDPWIPDLLGSTEKGLPRSSHTGDRLMPVDLLPSRRKRSHQVEQDHWGVEDEKVAGVHWSYEETRTLLAILSQTEFYEALRSCHRNSQVYGAVAEQLRDFGFLRTLEQCRTKFKGLQKSYRKVKSGHPSETCPFFEEMEALMSAQVIALPSNVLEKAASHSALVDSDAETEKPRQEDWQPDGEAEAAMVEDSESEETGPEATPQHSKSSSAPVLFRSPSGKRLLDLGIRFEEG
ncbi:LOW QUALITY PROTEIN: zinc finger and SCAN domain-containing protein 29 [Rhynchocyon petersi]